MGEQKNLFLAIGLSVAIIVIFQILFPQQTAMTPPAKNEVEQLQPATSIDDIAVEYIGNPNRLEFIANKFNGRIDLQLIKQ